MADWEKARKKRCYELFIKLECVKQGNEELSVDDEDFSVTQLDEEKMVAHLLDCYAALGVVQQERVRTKQPLVLRGDGQPLSADMQAVRNEVLKASIRILDDELVHDDAPVPNVDSSTAVKLLLHAFPDETKQTDGRGWLPLHWISAMGSTAAGISEEEMKLLYAMDPMAFQRHHQEGTNWDDDLGFTPAHLLCMGDSSNMSLIKHFSIKNQRAFTMSASYRDRGDPLLYGYSALHAACFEGEPTLQLLKHLLQLDSLQTKKMARENARTPLGLLCAQEPEEIQSPLLRCLLDVDSSIEVIGDGIESCIQNTHDSCLLEKMDFLLKANPEAAKYRNSTGCNLLHVAAYNSLPFTLCIDVMKRILAIHKVAMREIDEDGWLPIHFVACRKTVEVMEFLLGLYPESASIITTDESCNHLHLTVRDTENSTSVFEAKVRFLCTRYPQMILQKDCLGKTPLHDVMISKSISTVYFLCEIGGKEQFKEPIAHPSQASYWRNGWLPLHLFIHNLKVSLSESLISEEADCFRMLLRCYPEAVGIMGGVGARHNKTPYQLAVDKKLPPYYLRLLLRAAPNLNPAELHRLNYEERRMAIFLAFSAVTSDVQTLLLARLRFEKKDLVKHVISFL